MVKVLSKAFFLDRDGIINKSLIKKGKPLAPKKLSQFKIIKDVDKSLVFLKQLGFINIIITNHIGGLTYESINKTDNFIFDVFFKMINDIK